MAWYARRERREAWLAEQRRQRRRDAWCDVLWYVLWTSGAAIFVWLLVKGLEAIGW